jgi:hypothetical protein
MAHKDFNNRMKNILKQVEENGPSFSVIKQYPGESIEALQQRADQQKKKNIQQFGHPSLIVMIRNFSAKEAKNDTKQ